MGGRGAYAKALGSQRKSARAAERIMRIITGGIGRAKNSAAAITKEVRTIDGKKVQVERGIDHVFSNGTGTNDPTNYTFKSDVYTLDDGTKIYFKQSMGANQTLTPEQLITAINSLPKNVRSVMQKEVEVVDYANPRDAYWRQRYGKDFPGSYMTGGVDRMVVYKYTVPHDNSYLREAISHEIGHRLDGINRDLSLSNAWAKAVYLDTVHTRDMLISKLDKRLLRPNITPAMKRRIQSEIANIRLNNTGLTAVSDYGSKSPREDFADSVAYYTTGVMSFTNKNPTSGGKNLVLTGDFSSVFPHRYAIIESLLGPTT